MGDDWVDAVERRIDAELGRLGDQDDPTLRRRLEAWKLRVLGHSIEQVADLLGISIATAWRDLRWCLDNVPAAYENAEDYRRVSLRRLDEMIRRHQLSTSDAGDRTILAVADMQAKLLGAYAPSKVDASVTVRTELAGVDVGEL